MTPGRDPERDDGNSPGAPVVPAVAFGVIDATGPARVASFAGFLPAPDSDTGPAKVADLHGQQQVDNAPVADFASPSEAPAASVVAFEPAPIDRPDGNAKVAGFVSPPKAPAAPVVVFEPGPVDRRGENPPAGAQPFGLQPASSRRRSDGEVRDRKVRGRRGSDDSRPEGSRGRGGLGRPAQLDPAVDPVAAAKDICLRLLTDRSRTRLELAQALSRRGVPEHAAETVLSRFDEVGLIDDAAFAGRWVRSRHTHRGLARRAIAAELRRKGVDDDVAGEALALVDPVAEERRARELVDRKLRTIAVETPEQRAVAARRLVGMLARKGYGGSVAYRAVREALAARGADDEAWDDDGPSDGCTDADDVLDR